MSTLNETEATAPDFTADDLFDDELPATQITRPAFSHEDRADDEEFLFYLERI